MLLFMDGMAHYASAGIGSKYSAVDTTACTWTIVPEGRFGNCVKRVSTSNTNNAGYLSIAPLTTRLGPWTPTNSGVLGFAIKVDDFGKLNSASTSPQNHLLVIREGAGSHLRVNLNVDGTFSLIRNIGSSEGSGGAEIMAQSIEGLTEATWAYIEFKWVLHSSAGSFEIRVNNITVLTYSGDTREHEIFFNSLGVWNAVRLLGMTSVPTGSGGLTVRMCDLYLADLASTLSADVDDFLGDGIIITIFPNATGSATEWTPVPGANNWDMTNDRPAPDGDTTYVRTAVQGLRDVYHFEDIPAGATVLGAHYNALALKEDEGSVVLQPIVHQGGTDYIGPQQGIATLTYDHYLTQSYDLNPATGAQWTAAEINAGQFGIKKTL